MKERLKTLLYNAIGYMLETSMGDESLTIEECQEEIADYLGSTVNELNELDILDCDELIKNNNNNTK